MKFDLKQLKETFLTRWRAIFRTTREGEEVQEVGKEKVIVFIVAIILALCPWLMVNLSQDHNIIINLPIALGNMPPDQSLSQDLPDYATVSASGEGWQLLNMYNNPPQIFVDVSESEVNLYDQIQQQMNPTISVQKVQPLILSVDLEEKITRQVPVIPNMKVAYRDRYSRVGEARVVPDSIAISGAASVVENIDRWHTEPVELTEVDSDIAQELVLQESDDLITLSRSSVTYRAEIVEFTEGEVRVPILTRDLPEGRSVSYSPSTLSVRFDIPINEYQRVQESIPFTAFVSYNQIQNDSTGFVTPQFDLPDSSLHINIRSHRPSEVAYFIVIQE